MMTTRTRTAKEFRMRKRTTLRERRCAQNCVELAQLDDTRSSLHQPTVQKRAHWLTHRAMGRCGREDASPHHRGRAEDAVHLESRTSAELHMILPRALAFDSEAEVDRLSGRSHSYASLGHSDDDGVPEPGGQPLFARAAARTVDGTPGAGATVWGAVRVLLFTLMVVMLALMSGANEEPLTEAFARSPPSGGGGGGAAVLGRTLSAFVITTNDSSPRALSTRALLRNLSFGDVQLQRAHDSRSRTPPAHSLPTPPALTPHTAYSAHLDTLTPSTLSSTSCSRVRACPPPRLALSAVRPPPMEAESTHPDQYTQCTIDSGTRPQN